MEPRYYDSVPALLAETDKLYSKITAKWPEKTKWRVTMDKIVAARDWKPSLPLIEKNFEKVLTDLNFFFLPKAMVPGPLFVFPIIGLDGNYSYAQTKPLQGSVLFGKSKYMFLGDRPYTPNWLGNTPDTIRRIIREQQVLLVEGPFDLLACRLLCPDLPIMSTLTKKVGKKHEAYLRILGVKKLFLLFDNERSKKENQTQGAGNLSMEASLKQIRSMTVKTINCPASDPSEALTFSARASQLRGTLKRELCPVFEYQEE